MRNLARNLVLDPDLAEDVVQDTVLVTLSRPPASGDGHHGWIRAVIRRLAHHSRRERARRRHREKVAAQPEQSPSPAPEVLMERVELHRQIAAAVLELDEPYRETLVSRYFGELSAAEIARRSGVPEATVRSRLQRALHQLREKLDREHGGNRKAWVTGVVTGFAIAGSEAPLPSEGAVVPSVPVGHMLVKGALIMGGKKLVGAVVVVLVILAGVSIWMPQPAEPPSGGEIATAPPSDLAEGPGPAAPTEPASSSAERLAVSGPFIRGSVVESDTGQPVAGVRVVVRPTGRDRPHEILAETVTDGAGIYRVPDPFRGEGTGLEISAEHSDFVATSLRLRAIVRPWPLPLPPISLRRGDG